MNILAIDLGKFNSMCCFFETKTQEYPFQAAATTRRYLTASSRTTRSIWSSWRSGGLSIGSGADCFAKT
jgi:hypothetical protein